MTLEFTAVFRRVPEGYIGFVEELPGANTQGATLEEARSNSSTRLAAAFISGVTMVWSGTTHQYCESLPRNRPDRT